MDWISEMTLRVASATGLDATELVVDAGTRETLLDLVASDEPFRQ